MKLSQIKIGQRFRVLKVDSEGEIGKRLVEMGFVFGAEGRVIRVALLGDPIQICLGGYNISIRKSEAEKIIVEQLPECRKIRNRHGRRWWWNR